MTPEQHTKTEQRNGAGPSPYLLAYDIGTSSCKACVFSEELTILQQGRGAYPLHLPGNGRAEQNPLEILRGLQDATRELAARGCDLAAVRAISFSSMISAQCLVLEDGTPLTNIYSWMDSRATEETDRLLRDLTAEQLEQWTGLDMIVTPAYGISKLLWLKRHLPDTLKRARYFVQIKEFILHYLSGVWVSDANSLKGLVHPSTNRPVEEVFDYLGISGSILPEIREPYAIAGTLRADAAGFEGLTPGIPLIVGWNDMNAAFLGMVGFPDECVGLDLTGTSEHLGILRPNGASGSCEGVNHVPFLTGRECYYGVTSSGGQAIEWFVRDVLRQPSTGAYFRSLREQRLLPVPGDDTPICLPYFEGERNPWNAPDARGAFLGVKRSHQQEHLAQAVLEGVCFALHTILDCLPEQPSRFVVSGGASADAIWNQMKADVLGIPFVRLHTTEAGCNGAAMLAMFALHPASEWSSIQERMLRTTQTFRPDPARHDRYAEKYRRFLHLYHTVEPLLKEGTC